MSKVQELNYEAKRGLVKRLDEAQYEFARSVVDLAEELWGKIPGKRRKPKSYREQRYRIRKLRNMAEVVCTTVKLGTAPGPMFQKRLRELRASGIDPQIDSGNLEAWVKWEQWLATRSSVFATILRQSGGLSWVTNGARRRVCSTCQREISASTSDT